MDRLVPGLACRLCHIANNMCHSPAHTARYALVVVRLRGQAAGWAVGGQEAMAAGSSGVVSGVAASEVEAGQVGVGEVDTVVARPMGLHGCLGPSSCRARALLLTGAARAGAGCLAARAVEAGQVNVRQMYTHVGRVGFVGLFRNSLIGAGQCWRGGCGGGAVCRCDSDGGPRLHGGHAYGGCGVGREGLFAACWHHHHLKRLRALLQLAWTGR